MDVINAALQSEPTVQSQLVCALGWVVINAILQFLVRAYFNWFLEGKPYMLDVRCVAIILVRPHRLPSSVVLVRPS